MIFDKVNVPSQLIPSDPRFGCGPSLIPVERLEALVKTGKHLLGTSHRHAAVRGVVDEIIVGLRTYFNIPKEYDVVLGNGGATFLFDMLPLTLVEKKVTHYTCGEFSQKWFAAAKRVPWIEAKEVAAKMGDGIDAVDEADSDMIATTLNETSTGVQMTKMPKLHDPSGNRLLAVDATSGAGQVPCVIGETDVFFFSPQKVFASDGGLWVAFLSPKAVAKIQKVAAIKGRYVPEIMRFEHALENSRKAQTYNTPAIATLFFLNEQVKELNKLGYKKVCDMAAAKAQLIYSWAQEKPYLSAFIKEERFRSQAVATIDVDDKVKADDVVEFISKKKWVYGIDGYRKLGRNQMRISLFHNVAMEDLKKLTGLLSTLIEAAL